MLQIRPLARTALLIAALVALAGLARLAPHAPNMTPVAAIGLFAAFATRRASLGVLASLLAIALSDLAVGGYDAGVQAVVWASLAIPALLGARIAQRRGIALFGLAGGAVLLGSVAFFLATNLAVWAFSGMYAQTGAGLAACFAAAVPFFKFTLAGDLAWTGALFGAWALLTAPRRAHAR